MCDSVPKHRRHDCLLNHLFRHISEKTSKLRVIGFGRRIPLTKPVTRKTFPFDDVMMFVVPWQCDNRLTRTCCETKALYISECLLSMSFQQLNTVDDFINVEYFNKSIKCWQSAIQNVLLKWLAHAKPYFWHVNYQLTRHYIGRWYKMPFHPHSSLLPHDHITKSTMHLSHIPQYTTCAFSVLNGA